MHQRKSTNKDYEFLNHYVDNRGEQGKYRKKVKRQDALKYVQILSKKRKEHLASV